MSIAFELRSGQPPTSSHFNTLLSAVQLALVNSRGARFKVAPLTSAEAEAAETKRAMRRAPDALHTCSAPMGSKFQVSTRAQREGQEAAENAKADHRLQPCRLTIPWLTSCVLLTEGECMAFNGSFRHLFCPDVSCAGSVRLTPQNISSCRFALLSRLVVVLHGCMDAQEKVAWSERSAHLLLTIRQVRQLSRFVSNLLRCVPFVGCECSGWLMKGCDAP